jgi:hypothetical protein
MSRPATRNLPALIVCAALLILALPALVRAQATPSIPPAAAPAAPPEKAPAAPAMSAPKASAAPLMSDSAKAAVRAEVTKQLKTMADTLKLTQEQRDKARPILLDHAYQMRQLRNKYAGMERTPENRAAMQKDAAALRDATDAKLAAVLTGDQMTAYKKWRDEAMGRARAKMSMPADSTKK